MGIIARISEVKELCGDGLLWMRIWKTFPVLSWMRAAKAFKTGNYSKAINYYRLGLTKYPSHPAHFSARYDLAYCLEKLGYIEEAIQEVSYIISLRQKFKEAYLMRSKLLSHLGKYSFALETLKIANNLYPDDILVLSKLLHASIDVAIDAKEIEKNKKKLQELLLAEIFTNGSNCVEAMTAIAHYELVFGDEIKADQMLNKIFTRTGDNLQGNILRGVRMLSHGRVIQAREHFRKAHLIDPMDPIPQALIAETYLRSGNSEEVLWAVQLAESACRASKWKNPDAIDTLITAYEANSELAKVELFSERLKSIDHRKFILSSIKLRPLSMASND